MPSRWRHHGSLDGSLNHGGWPTKGHWLDSVFKRLDGTIEFIATNHLTPPSVQASIPPILHSIVAPSMQTPCDFCPALSHFSNHSFYHSTFLRTDRLMVQRGFQILMIPFTALLWRPRSD